MIEIGEKISNLPFGKMELVNELLVYDGMPIVSHFSNERGEDILGYWVDYNSAESRWLFTKISKNELYRYLKGITSLKKLFKEILSDFVFIADFDKSRSIKNASIVSSHLIPDDYLPGDGSYYQDGLSEFYINYLSDFEYDFLLKERSYIIKAEPSVNTHGNFVSAKEGAYILERFCSSIEGYIDVTATIKYEKRFTSKSRINNVVKSLKKHLSPVVTGAVINSFEVWLAIDTITLNLVDDIGAELKSEVVEGYKHDVLDVDFTSEDDAKLICDKFNPTQRKKIYQPVIDVITDKPYEITISDTRKTLRHFKPVRSNEKFIKRVIPPPSPEELLAEKDKRKRIYHLFLNLEEGTDILKLSKKQISESLLTLFSDDKAEYPINFKVQLSDGPEKPLKKPIPGTIVILDNNDIELRSDEFNISVTEKEINKAINEFKQKFVALYHKNLALANPSVELTSLFDKYLD